MHEQLTLDGSPPLTVVVHSLPEPDTALDVLVQVHGFDAVEAALGRIKIAMSGPIPQVGQRTDDQRTSIGKRSDDVRRFKGSSLAGRMLFKFAHNEAGLTDAEATFKVLGRIGEVGVSRWEGCRRRASDLRAAGYIADSDAERDGRIVWVLTPQGRKAVQNIVNSGWSR